MITNVDLTRVHGSLHAIDHLLCGHYLFARPMTTAFGLHLIFNVHAGGARLGEDFTVRAMLNAPPQPLSASTNSGSVLASVIRWISISTSSMVLMPISGRLNEFADAAAG